MKFVITMINLMSSRGLIQFGTALIFSDNSGPSVVERYFSFLGNQFFWKRLTEISNLQCAINILIDVDVQVSIMWTLQHGLKKIHKKSTNFQKALALISSPHQNHLHI